MAPPVRISPRPKLSPTERREYVALGVKAGKSQRLLAEQLGVTDVTIRRDLAHLNLIPLKEPTVTRRKKAAVWKTSRQKTAEKKLLEDQKTKRFRKIVPPANARGRRRVTLPEKPKPTRLRLEQPRKRRSPEMVDLVESWLYERRYDYRRSQNVLDKARNRLKAKPAFYINQLSDPSLSAAELLAQARPQEMDSAGTQSISRREEVCALWLARWLAAWSPCDEELRDAVLTQTRGRLRIN